MTIRLRLFMSLLALAGTTPALAKVRVKSAALLDFTYTAPRVADAPLQAWLARDRDIVRAKALVEATTDRAAARQDKRDFMGHGADVSWTLLGSMPRLHSLVGTYYRFTGGAHGSTGSRALLWDRRVRRPVPAGAVITAAAWQAIRPLYCRTLRAEQVRRTENNVSDMNACPAFKDVAVVPSGRDGRFDRLQVIADQYVAGSYAEGNYEIDLPVTPAVIAAIPPAWRADFATSALPATAATPK